MSPLVDDGRAQDLCAQFVVVISDEEVEVGVAESLDEGHDGGRGGDEQLDGGLIRCDVALVPANFLLNVSKKMLP